MGLEGALGVLIMTVFGKRAGSGGPELQWLHPSPASGRGIKKTAKINGIKRKCGPCADVEIIQE